MTYSGPLVVSVVLGLMTGHFGLQLPRVLKGGSGNGGVDLPVEEGCTPCCQNEMTSLHTDRTEGSPNSSDASTGSSSSDPGKSQTRNLLPQVKKKTKTVAHTAVEVLGASKPTPTPTADASRKESPEISCCGEPIISNDVSETLDVEYGSINTEEDCCC
mmetsp:Transcript_14886/g.15067  ORF Transcript_14886/g.15067 Transcript_14886/m.15067 type:complete len:159 (-) Transcript_14886:15-491(-)